MAKCRTTRIKLVPSGEKSTLETIDRIYVIRDGQARWVRVGGRPADGDFRAVSVSGSDPDFIKGGRLKPYIQDVTVRINPEHDVDYCLTRAIEEDDRQLLILLMVDLTEYERNQFSNGYESSLRANRNILARYHSSPGDARKTKRQVEIYSLNVLLVLPYQDKFELTVCATRTISLVVGSDGDLAVSDTKLAKNDEGHVDWPVYRIK